MGEIRAYCEMKPLLRVANVYIRWPGKCPEDVVVAVKDGVAGLSGSFGVVNLNFPKSVKLQDVSEFVPTVAGEEYLYLRLATVPEEGTSGSSSTEVVGFPSFTKPQLQSQRVFIPRKDTPYSLSCTQCVSLLSACAAFQRVLPLPSNSWTEAASDWYCCGHNVKEKPDLRPRQGDCLYGSCFYSLSRKIFNADKTSTTGSGFHCTSCGCEIGAVCKETVLIWLHSVCWEEPGSCPSQPWHTPLQSFYTSLSTAMEEETALFGRKFLFNDSQQALTVWFIGDCSTCFEGSAVLDDESAGLSVDLDATNHTKILFKYDAYDKHKKLDSVAEHDVSSAMLASAVADLQRSSLRLPPTFRIAAGFTVAFLDSTDVDNCDLLTGLTL